MKDVPAIIILLDTYEDGNAKKNGGRLSYNHTLDTSEDEISMKMVDVPATIILLDTFEDRTSLENEGRLSRNRTFRCFRGWEIYGK